MKQVRAWIWKVGRVALAIILLALIFKLKVIQLRDSVTLVDGTQIRGQITVHPPRDLTVQRSGGSVTYSYLQILYDKDRYEVFDRHVILNTGDRIEGDAVTGTIETKGKRSKVEVAANLSAFQRPSGMILVHGDAPELSFALHEVAVEKQLYRIEDGLITNVRRMIFGGYMMGLAGLALLGIVPVVGALRWRMLLAGQGIGITRRRAIDLTLIGLFFNNFMPGLTGGDVVKAYYASRLAADKKTPAVVTVFLDRIIGIVALGIVAGAAILLGLSVSGAIADSNYKEAAWFVLGFMVISIGGGVCFYSRRLRRLLSATVRALPGYDRVRRMRFVSRAAGLIKRIDSSLLMYRHQKMVLFNTTAISFIAHASAILAIYCFGRGLGITQAGVLHYFAVVPVGFILSSIGITPAGWGVGEWVFGVLFSAVGVEFTAAVTMSVIYRLTQALWTLPGGVLFMFERDRRAITEAAEMPEALLEGDDAAAGD